MANFSYKDYETKKETGDKEFKVGFFGLKDDGDEAIVRFNYSSLDEFNIVTVHNIKSVGKDGKETYKRVSCLRGANDPIEKCPLCASGNKLALKFYVKLIEYVKTEDGHIVPKARVWERPASFASDLKSFLDEYTNLTDFVFKIKRRGARGDMQTKYDIIPARQDIYKPEIYAKDFSGFDDFKLAGSSYMVKTVEEMNAYLKTGEFPKVEKAATTATTATASTGTVPAGATTSTNLQTHATPAEQKSQTPANPTDGRPQRYTF